MSLAEADEAFHEIIYQASGNLRLNQVVSNLREQMYRYRLEYLKEEEARKQLVKEHNELCQALKQRDTARAQAIAFGHIENQRRAILKSVQNGK